MHSSTNIGVGMNDEPIGCPLFVLVHRWSIYAWSGGPERKMPRVPLLVKLTVLDMAIKWSLSQMGDI